MAKTITMTDIEKRNADLERTLEEVRSDRDRVRGELRDLRADHTELRHKADDLQKQLTAALRYQADLQRNVGVLEGYKMRVERVDDLDRGRRPQQHIDGQPPDAASGINPHYRERDGFFQR
jgi:chromosome segregation ATPase